MLRLDRMRALVDVYPGLEREDEMVAAFDYCLHGKGGAAPSIDTAMHGLVDAAHVDHLHPDSGIAIATAADGEALTAEDLRRQGGVGAVASPRLPARPRHRRDQGGEPAGDRLHPRRPRHHRVGRHLRGGRGELAVDHRHRRGVHRRARPPRAVRRGARRATRRCPRPSAARRRPPWRRRSADSPRTTSRWSGTSPTRDVVLDFLASAEHPRLAALGTSCPDHFLRTKVKPMLLDLPATATVEEQLARLKELHEEYRADYQAYYDAHATAGQPRDPRRRPAHRARARASACSATARTSRPPASPASSTSTRST